MKQIDTGESMRSTHETPSDFPNWILTPIFPGRFLQDGEATIDNNHIENLMRPWAMGRKAWLFACRELAGQCAAMVMSLVQSARLNGREPWSYLRDVLKRLLEHPNHHIDELLMEKMPRKFLCEASI